MAPWGASWLPVASTTASASATSDAAASRSPTNSCTPKRSIRAMGSRESAPALRASCTWRSVSSSQLASSPKARAMRQASQSQRSASSSDMGSSRKARSARFSVGAAAA